MTAEKFADLVGYKPKHITKGLKGDPNPVRLICFRDFNKHSATAEFGCKLNQEKHGYYFYFEVLDMNGYKEMDFIPLDSSRRHDVIFCWPKTDDDYMKLAKHVNDALRKMHKK